ncbi:hypothetical protein [Novosphingobium capsulatum]|uniref:hypothetical protein n=1 Tax=Novosphingobium capsulatum TaxID=13688 RepID=UPI002E12871A|nr:hypothetical protein U0041_03685 [Novosphingobium capsulatum]
MIRQNAIRYLFIFWISAAVFSTAILTVQSLAHRYGEDSQAAWNWLLGQYTPVLSILLAAVFSDPSKRWREAQANVWRFKCAIAISVLQAIAMIGLLLIQPFLNGMEVSPFDLFESTQSLLALVQGVAVAAVGAVIFDGR